MGNLYPTRGGLPVPAAAASQSVGLRAGPVTAQSEMCSFVSTPNKCFVLTYVVLGQIVAHLSNLFLINKEKRKTKQAAEKQSRSPFVSTSSDDLDNDKVYPVWASMASMIRVW